MYRKLVKRVALSVMFAASVVVFSACDENPTSPDAGIRFNPLAGCAGLNGTFFTPAFVVIPDGRPGSSVAFPVLIVVADGRFTSTTFVNGLPSITNVGSFSISGGYVIFGEKPLTPQLPNQSQFNCQLSGNNLFLSGNALFAFGSGRPEPARINAELTRR